MMSITQSLKWCGAADDFNIGLEFYRKSSEIDDRTKEFLDRGIHLFKLLEINPQKLKEDNRIFNKIDIIAFELYETLNFSIKLCNRDLPEDTFKKAQEYKKIIDNLIHNNITVSKEKVEEIQDFTDTIEVLLLQRVRRGF